MPCVLSAISADTPLSLLAPREHNTQKTIQRDIRDISQMQQHLKRSSFTSASLSKLSKFYEQVPNPKNFVVIVVKAIWSVPEVVIKNQLQETGLLLFSWDQAILHWKGFPLRVACYWFYSMSLTRISQYGTLGYVSGYESLEYLYFFLAKETETLK